VRSSSLTAACPALRDHQDVLAQAAPRPRCGQPIREPDVIEWQAQGASPTGVADIDRRAEPRRAISLNRMDEQIDAMTGPPSHQNSSRHGQQWRPGSGNSLSPPAADAADALKFTMGCGFQNGHWKSPPGGSRRAGRGAITRGPMGRMSGRPPLREQTVELRLENWREPRCIGRARGHRRGRLRVAYEHSAVVLPGVAPCEDPRIVASQDLRRLGLELVVTLQGTC
jgi:hypothetical protein